MNTRILASLLIIGVVGAFATGSTFALFNDKEESSGNTFTAGAVDLQIDWTESYNGEIVETQELSDLEGQPIFQLGDVKPGDEGEATVSVHVFDNPAWLWMRANLTENADNSCVEPEADAEEDMDCTADDETENVDDGELADNMNFLVWYDEDGDNVHQNGEEVIFNGTAAEFNNEANEGLALDGDRDTEGRQSYENSTTQYIGVKWWVPMSTGNEVQTDSVEFDFEFFAEQERNNPNPDNPFVEQAPQ